MSWPVRLAETSLLRTDNPVMPTTTKLRQKEIADV